MPLLKTSTVIALSLLATAALSSVSLAGSTSLTNKNGDKVAIRCDGGGCYVNNSRVGDGGSKNFEKLVWQYGRKGYK